MAIGDLVGTLSVTGNPSEAYVLTSNPNGYFSVSGANLLQASNSIPSGVPLPFSVSAIGPGVSIPSFPFTIILGSSPTNGPMDFSVPGNIGITGALP